MGAANSSADQMYVRYIVRKSHWLSPKLLLTVQLSCANLLFAFLQRYLTWYFMDRRQSKNTPSNHISCVPFSGGRWDINSSGSPLIQTGDVKGLSLLEFVNKKAEHFEGWNTILWVEVQGSMD